MLTKDLITTVARLRRNASFVMALIIVNELLVFPLMGFLRVYNLAITIICFSPKLQ